MRQLALGTVQNNATLDANIYHPTVSVYGKSFAYERRQRYESLKGTLAQAPRMQKAAS